MIDAELNASESAPLILVNLPESRTVTHLNNLSADDEIVSGVMLASI